ncbi:GGDEF domain-containing protein [Georgenia subflava]|uniref:Diguanylate cyclase n=1 Tax=Georgenia subflava TaxID=1622177 RepID=A0A6N7EM95_9MICO|nr:diguanylate cyclase [Georgenia subflava]MPV37977.1 diguanylate cyclase [Georgenia subflava]
MILDLTTVQAVAAVVVLTSSVVFLSEVWARDGDTVDRLWSMAFLAAVATGVAYLAATIDPALWWANAVGNGASVLTTFAMWSGVRAHLGRRPLVEVSLAAAVVALLATVVQGPDGGPWAGGIVVLLGTAAGGLLGGAALVRGGAVRLRAAVLLAVVLITAGVFYAVRAVVYLVAGPESAAFRLYLGTEVTTVVVVLLVNGAAFSMVVLRGRYARDRQDAARNFDPMTGARTGVSFQPRAHEQLRDAAASGRPVALVAIAPEGVGQIAVAFGREFADQALVTAGEITQMLLPPRALIGRDELDGQAFQVLLPGYSAADAQAWATQVRKELIDTPLDVPGSRLRLTASVGIATDRTDGYALEALCDSARRTSQAALGAGGNRVLVAGESDRTDRSPGADGPDVQS